MSAHAVAGVVRGAVGKEGHRQWLGHWGNGKEETFRGRRAERLKEPSSPTFLHLAMHLIIIHPLGLQVVLQLLPPPVMETILLEDTPAVLMAVVTASAVPPAPPAPAYKLTLYRTILNCLVLALRRLGPSLWLHRGPAVTGGAGAGDGEGEGDALAGGDIDDALPGDVDFVPATQLPFGANAGTGMGMGSGLGAMGRAHAHMHVRGNAILPDGPAGLADTLMTAMSSLQDEATQKASVTHQPIRQHFAICLRMPKPIGQRMSIPRFLGCCGTYVLFLHDASIAISTAGRHHSCARTSRRRGRGALAGGC